MTTTTDDFLTTRELADMLRIKERKVYDLANHGDVPCVRVVGKLLFPRAAIVQWMEAARSGPLIDTTSVLPSTILGSHDPLLEWALLESGSGLAAFSDGSRDGLRRLLEREGIACGTHVYEQGEWNTDAVKSVSAGQPMVLIEFAQRVRGLIVAPGNPMQLTDVSSVVDCRMARRQAGAASQELFEQLMTDAGLNLEQVSQCPDSAHTEDELGMQIFDGKADVAFGLQSVATRLRLGFVPLMNERFDLLVWRQAWFEPPFQKLLAFFQTAAFTDKAAALGGYDVSTLGQVRYNAP